MRIVICSDTSDPPGKVRNSELVLIDLSAVIGRYSLALLQPITDLYALSGVFAQSALLDIPTSVILCRVPKRRALAARKMSRGLFSVLF